MLLLFINCLKYFYCIYYVLYVTYIISNYILYYILHIICNNSIIYDNIQYTIRYNI